MGWDPVWEQVYQTREWGRYPPEELIRFMAGRFHNVADRKRVRALELGCGAGANLWYLAREGFEAHGIDGSETAVAHAIERLSTEGLRATIHVGDVLSLRNIYEEGGFDAVIDVDCLQHNPVESIRAMIGISRSLLRAAGSVFSMMAARGSWGDGMGMEIEPGTFRDIHEGPAQGMGLCHFATREELRELFAGFEEVQIDYSMRSLDGGERYFKHWVIQGVKAG